MPDMGGDSHYWSYRALMEDKKRCLTHIQHIQHAQCNSLRQEGLDATKSQRALDEAKRHLAMDLNRAWDTEGAQTPPHAFATDENRPFYSQKKLSEEKARMRTDIRQAANPRPVENAAPAMEPSPRGCGKRMQGAEDKEPVLWEAPTMTQLMQPGKAMEATSTERTALRERRSSSVPHNSHRVLTMKKHFHATKIHEKPAARRCQSARELSQLSFLGGETPRDSETGYVEDPTRSSYQGRYPHGTSSEAWPSGRDDPSQPGRYRSARYLAVDKRRHAATIDGSAAQARANARQQQSSGESQTLDADGYAKPDFCARADKYKSQYALTQHKRRHLANLHHDEEDYGKNPYTPRTPASDGTVQQDLFTSHKHLEYGKRGHVVQLNSARTAARRARSEDGISSVGSSSCDVGKGISRMMNKHKDDVHTSQRAFHLKKKNHATSVHSKPKPPRSSDGSDKDSNCGNNVLNETRRPSDPHDSCKAFALKKKYHQTSVHVKSDSRLHPDVQKDKGVDRNPPVLSSQRHLSSLKKLHSFEYNPETRRRPEPKPVPIAPKPRNGQWTPQHVCD